MVLHDLNLAARYADHLVVLKNGEVVALGPPSSVVTAEMLREVFGVDAEIFPDPRTGTPLVIPHGLSEDLSGTDEALRSVPFDDFEEVRGLETAQA